MTGGMEPSVQSPLLHIMSQHTDLQIPLPGPQAHLEGKWQVGLRPVGLEKAVRVLSSQTRQK